MRYAPFVIALLCAAVLFTGLGLLPFVDQREARDAAVARELIVRHEPLTPVLRGEPLFEKPIPAYVPDVIAAAAGDRAPLRSRQARAVLATMLLLLVASIGAEHFGARAGWLAAGALCTSFALPLAARVDGTQVIGTLLAWLAVSGFADATFGRHGAGRDSRLLVSWVALAGAAMTAGPLTALWPPAAALLYGALVKRPGMLARLRAAPGLAIVAGVSLPWYGAMIERHGTAFLSHAPFFPYAAETRGPWFAGPLLAITLLVVGSFPWSALLPEAMLHAASWWRRPRAPLPPGATRAADYGLDPVSREWREESAAHFFIACLIASLVPLAIYPGPPLSAALPALPAVALLCARLLDHLFEDAPRVARLVGRSLFMLGVIGSTAAVLIAMIALRARDAAPELRHLGAFVLLASWAPFLAGFSGRPRLAAALVALPIAAGTPIVALRTLPALQDYLHARAVASAMDAVSPPRAALVLPDPPPPSLQLYAERHFVIARPVSAVLRELRAPDGYAYVAYRPLREPAVAHEADAPLEVLVRTPALVLARVPVAADAAPPSAARAHSSIPR
jgi:4-amino-4-deoxy-L-arabinose transferase-like glycosyltransferase